MRMHMSETLGCFDAPKKSFCFSRSLLSVAAVLALSGVCAHAEPASTGQSDGEKLERQMAADIKAKNWTAVESRIAEGFQSVHPDGIRDRAAEIALLKNMNLGDFTLSDFKSTTIDDNIVVTFTMTVAETVDGKRLPAKPAYRLSVWKKGVNGWEWICHANLAPIR
jgi:uncharacterized protein DUF4440